MLAEMACLGQAAGEDQWPPHRLMASAQARSSVARIAGDPKAALVAERKRLALEKAAGATLLLSMSNLMDAEIAAGEAAEAVQTGLELMGHLQDSREAYALSNGRLNLAAAWLALGEPGQARALASAAWPVACGFNQQAYWADYLSLLACQEMRWRSAAMLAGYSEQAYINSSTIRDRNEASAFNQAVTLARSALGDDEFERLAATGCLMTDDAAALCAFGLDDTKAQATT